MYFARMLLAWSASMVFIGAHAAQPVSVLGLPVGGTLNAVPKVCSTDKPKTPCWQGKPTTAADGDLQGPVKLPGSHQLPPWAASAQFYFRVQKDAKLLSLTIRTGTGKDKEAIVRMVDDALRQPPDAKADGSTWSKVRWEKDGGSAYLLCMPEFCEIDFKSAELKAKLEKEAARRAEMEAKRRAERDAARREKLGLEPPAPK